MTETQSSGTGSGNWGSVCILFQVAVEKCRRKFEIFEEKKEYAN
jgi:hypothetical protein